MPARLHSCTASIYKNRLIISGGLVDGNASQDVYSLNLDTGKGEHLKLKGYLLPRYSHTSHVHGDNLVVLGGTHNIPNAGCKLPGIAVVNLKHGTVVELEISVCQIMSDMLISINQFPTSVPIMFVNHQSACIQEEGSGLLNVYVVGGGANCFSFGTHFNRSVVKLSIHLDEK